MSRRADLTWFVNLSPRELAAPRTVASFGSALDRHGIAPSSLVVEVTEHAAFVDGGIASGVVAELSRLGIGLALDDFGTGHSSLSTVLELPAGWIKIDRRFTAATVSERGRRLVAGIVDLAHRIDATTIAEGVETSEELTAVTALGVEYGQGYLFGRPVALVNDGVDAAEQAVRPAG
jgi:EAL domain-containing protein (putative c-di-GMP-specific phosphodiesterase class I)